jgi:hypothetical protein
MLYIVSKIRQRPIYNIVDMYERDGSTLRRVFGTNSDKGWGDMPDWAQGMFGPVEASCGFSITYEASVSNYTDSYYSRPGSIVEGNADGGSRGLMIDFIPGMSILSCVKDEVDGDAVEGVAFYHNFYLAVSDGRPKVYYSEGRRSPAVEDDWMNREFPAPEPKQFIWNASGVSIVGRRMCFYCLFYPYGFEQETATVQGCSVRRTFESRGSVIAYGSVRGYRAAPLLVISNDGEKLLLAAVDFLQWAG